MDPICLSSSEGPIKNIKFDFIELSLSNSLAAASSIFYCFSKHWWCEPFSDHLISLRDFTRCCFSAAHTHSTAIADPWQSQLRPWMVPTHGPCNFSDVLFVVLQSVLVYRWRTLPEFKILSQFPFWDLTWKLCSNFSQSLAINLINI